MLFCLANFATSLIFLMESSSSKLRSAMPLRGVAAMVSQRWCCGSYESGPLSVRHLSRTVQQCSDCGLCSGVTNLSRAYYQLRALARLPLRNEDLRVVTLTISMLQTAPRTGHLPKNELLAGPLVPLSCYGARTGAERDASPWAGRDGLGGDAHRFSHSRGIAGRAAAPTHRLVYAKQ